MQSYIADGEDYQRHLHCLIVSVTTQQELINNEQYVIVDEGLKNAKDVAVHLINWLVITYNGEEKVDVMQRTFQKLRIYKSLI